MPGLSILKPTSSVRPLTVIAGREAAPRLIDIAIAARRRASLDSQGYALANAPTSPYENLSVNRIPGVSLPRWLRGHYKCYQFV